MIDRALNKKLSQEHEDYLAKVYEGEKSKNSGNSNREKYDIKTMTSVIEGKTTGYPGFPKSSSLVTRMEKVREEALEIGREPALALRFYYPESSLADQDGWVNLTVRLSQDDAHRDISWGTSQFGY